MFNSYVSLPEGNPMNEMNIMQLSAIFLQVSSLFQTSIGWCLGIILTMI